MAQLVDHSPLHPTKEVPTPKSDTTVVDRPLHNLPSKLDLNGLEARNRRAYSGSSSHVWISRIDHICSRSTQSFAVPQGSTTSPASPMHPIMAFSGFLLEHSGICPRIRTLFKYAPVCAKMRPYDANMRPLCALAFGYTTSISRKVP